MRAAWTLLLLGLVVAGCGRREARPVARARDAGPALPESCAPGRRLAERAIDHVVRRPVLPPPRRATSLLTPEPTVVGRARSGARTLYRMERSALERAFARIEGDARIFESPVLPASARSATRLRLGLSFDGPGTIEIFPRSSTHFVYDRALRQMTIELDDAPATELREVSVDLTAFVHANWRVGSEAAGDRFESFELRIRSNGPWVTLRSFELDDGSVALEGAAGRASIDRDGTIHPSVFVRPGGRYAVRVRIPDDAGTLAFYAASDGTATLDVRVVDGSTSESIHHGAAADRWETRTLDVRRWSGREVEIALSAEGGIGYFGAPEIAPRVAARAPDVVVYLVDLLPATQLGAYGNPRPGLSPTIDRLHREGLAFGRMRSTSPWTKPAVPTLLTGIHPSVHRVGAVSNLDRLPASVVTLQRRFGERGHRTGSFAASPLGSTLSGLEVGFDTAVTPAAFDHAIGPMGQPTAAQLNERLLGFVDEAPERPFFAFVHSLDVHEYGRGSFASGPDPGDRTFDRALRQQDRALAELLATLRSRGRDVLFVLVSDHGEAFREFGRYGHGIGPFQSQVVIPLVFHWPGHLPRGVIDDVVSLVDVAPTLVELFGLATLEEADGESLGRYAFETAPRPVHDFVTSSREWFVFRPNEPPWYSAEDGSGHKVVQTGDERSYFELDADPCELRPVEGGESLHTLLTEERTRLGVRAIAFGRRHGRGRPDTARQDDLRRLRALGYVE